MRNFGRPAKRQYYENEIARQVDEARVLESRKPGNGELILGVPTASFYVSNPEGNQVFGIYDGLKYDGRLFSGLLGGRSPTGWKLRQNQKRKQSIEGIELVLSMPKSLSIYWALGITEANKAVTQSIIRLQDMAVRSAMRFFSDEIIQTRKGKGGATTVIGGVTAGAIFTHLDGRPIDDPGIGDPHVHSHFVLFNSVYRDGGCRAIDGVSIFNRKVITLINQAYHKALADGLRAQNVPFDRSIGVGDAITARLAGISTKHEAHFKKRSTQIRASIKTVSGIGGRSVLGVSGDRKARSYVALSTRRKKISNIVVQLLNWRDQLRAQNLTIAGLNSVWMKVRKAPKRNLKSSFTTSMEAYVSARNIAEWPTCQISGAQAWELDAKLHAIRLSFGLPEYPLERIGHYLGDARAVVQKRTSNTHRTMEAGERTTGDALAETWLKLCQLGLRPLHVTRSKIAELQRKVAEKIGNPAFKSPLGNTDIDRDDPAGVVRGLPVSASLQKQGLKNLSENGVLEGARLGIPAPLEPSEYSQKAPELKVEERQVQRMRV